MDWKYDTPPKERVGYPQIIGEKRNFGEYSNGEMVEEYSGHDGMMVTPVQSQFSDDEDAMDIDGSSFTSQVFMSGGAGPQTPRQQDPNAVVINGAGAQPVVVPYIAYEPVPARRLFNRVVGMMLQTVNFIRWGVSSTISGGRALVRSRRARQTGIAVYEVAGGVKRRAVEVFHHIRPTTNPRQLVVEARIERENRPRSPRQRLGSPPRSPRLRSSPPSALEILQREAILTQMTSVMNVPLMNLDFSPVRSTFSPLEQISRPNTGGEDPMAHFRPNDFSFQVPISISHDLGDRDIVMSDSDDSDSDAEDMVIDGQLSAQELQKAEKRAEFMASLQHSQARQSSEEASMYVSRDNLDTDMQGALPDAQEAPSASQGGTANLKRALQVVSPNKVSSAIAQRRRLRKEEIGTSKSIPRRSSLAARSGKKRTPGKRVVFYHSPTSGNPTSRLRLYVVGEPIGYPQSPSPSHRKAPTFDSIEEGSATDSPLAAKQIEASNHPLGNLFSTAPTSSLRDGHPLLQEPVTNAHPCSSMSSQSEILLANSSELSGVVAAGEGGRHRQDEAGLPINSNRGESEDVTEQSSDKGDAKEKLSESKILNTLEDKAASAMTSSEGSSPTPSTPAQAVPRVDQLAKAEPSEITSNPNASVPVTPQAHVDATGSSVTDAIEKDFGVLTISKRTRSSRKKREEEERRLQEEKEQAEREQAKAEQAQKEVEAAADIQRRRQRIIPPGKVITPLTAEWNAKVDTAMATRNPDAELAKSVAGQPLTRKDFGTVLPTSGRMHDDWLNDVIINAYMDAVVAYGKQKTDTEERRGATPKVHGFSTFFYTKLADEKNGGPLSVCRWASRAKVGGKNLLKVEKIFIPVHLGNHWTLMVLSPIDRQIEFYDSLYELNHEVHVKRVKKWIKAELGRDYVDDEWKFVPNRSPKQSNGSDCGVFTVTTAKLIMMGINPLAYSHEDIPTQRRRIVAELLNGGFNGDFSID
ncbi:MAG: hypothetical protein M1819_001456 [Sarea resinae]|nr:MAG: hypothetical protein M1819_001456 [Sarea resinae]